MTGKFSCRDYLVLANSYCGKTHTFGNECCGDPEHCCSQKDREQTTEWKYDPKIQAKIKAQSGK